ncbi:MarR family winged helix-turn-helix transcriptional regulator [Rhizobium ruizarguesonis]|jgi:MarR family transcriptional regulator for hemolysin|uniref:MarR family winged helix-turn-helix transcriptional regulator n=1 Tax=Rhizobium ruizarguesonis TaxID=2081791 RepID=UPI001031C480|nr:MarR family transcriptional regulator [Rhizobium ruizarguesonis]MBY5887097.1 MarR family transcriptional regulator [Rhizobium leguminosarum]NEK09503.1 MarR family transcriptional regulator [Rhizobium ruizarguesonis]QIJ43487.1 MarR family transcriptional regulator [Rhizobium leguminosarum]QSZ03856.1 MarR family transcriptional regulator [Rhizobium ruizarguesonis]TAW68904.1 MarR family transcriptional regulator [Rhizobium ruizarguesonis]
MNTYSNLQRVFTANLLSTGRQWRRAVDLALSSHGISEACAAPLLWIGRLGGGVRQVVLASHVGIEGPSLVRLLDQLETLGLVIRKDDPADRRAKGLWLTEQGATLAARMEKVLDDLRGHILQNVDKADLEAAIRVLQAFDNSEMPQPGTLEKQVEAAS